MSNQDLALMVNINGLVKDGWTVDMETGKRGGQVRSWVKLQHFERNLKFKVRSTPTDVQTALAMVMVEAGIEPFEPKAAPMTEDQARS